MGARTSWRLTARHGRRAAGARCSGGALPRGPARRALGRALAAAAGLLGVRSRSRACVLAGTGDGRGPWPRCRSASRWRSAAAGVAADRAGRAGRGARARSGAAGRVGRRAAGRSGWRRCAPAPARARLPRGAVVGRGRAGRGRPAASARSRAGRGFGAARAPARARGPGGREFLLAGAAWQPPSRGCGNGASRLELDLRVGGRGVRRPAASPGSRSLARRSGAWRGLETRTRRGCSRAGFRRAKPRQVRLHHPAASRYQCRRHPLIARISASDQP